MTRQPLAQNTMLQTWITQWYQCFNDQKQGGFHERLDQLGQPVDLGYKRLLSQCRQIFIYSEAGFQIDRLSDKFSFLVDCYHVPETGGWRFSVTNEGTAHDSSYDFYGHAFALLACAAYGQATGDSQAVVLAKKTIEFIHSNFRVKDLPGFIEVLDEKKNPVPKIRRQNPHMHLLEACLYADRVTQEDGYRQVAEEIVQLFKIYFYEDKSYTLGEFFDDSLSLDSQTGNHIEPGHHGEWVWLLGQYQQLYGNDTDLKKIMKNLYDWAIQHGEDQKYGGVYNVLDRIGGVIDSQKRIWVPCELIKAAQVMGDNDRAKRLSEFLQTHYVQKNGFWHEILEQSLQPVTDFMPATTPYHLFGALYGGC